MLRKAAYITTSWDDGHPLDMRLAELLSRYGLPGTFYTPLYNKGSILTPFELRELSRSFEIGAHTVHHCDLITVSNHVSKLEIEGCKSALEQITGRSCTSFCFPKGHFHRHHLSQVRNAGYRLARTVELMSFAAPRVQNGLALMPTSLQAVPAGPLTFARNSLKRLQPMSLFRYTCNRKSDWAGTAEALLERVILGGGVFHLWGHSWEIEETNQWQNIERIFALLSKHKGQAMYVDNSQLEKETRGE